MPDVWKDAVLLHHDQATEDLQSIGPRSWIKPLTEADQSQMENGMDRTEPKGAPCKVGGLEGCEAENTRKKTDQRFCDQC